MQNNHVLMFLTITFLFSTSSTQANDAFYKSDCFPVRPKIKELSPWLNDIGEKIKNEAVHEQVERKLTAQLQQYILCSLVVSDSGDVQSLKLVQSSGSERTDQLALKLIRRAGPFGSPPNELPSRGGTNVTFTTKNGELVILARARFLNPNWRIGGGVDQY